jgi:hypothetical protein
MRSFAWTLPEIKTDPPTEDNLDKAAQALQDLFGSVIKAAGRTRHQNDHSAPWWDANCRTAHKAYLESAEGTPEHDAARKNLRDTTRKSKKEHRDKIIANAGIEGRIWSLASRRKTTDRFQPPPLVDGSNSVSDPTERATYLRDKLLKRKPAGEDILDPWSQDAPRRTKRLHGTHPSRTKKSKKPQQAQATQLQERTESQWNS